MASPATDWRYLLCKALRRLRPYADVLRMTIDDLYRRFRGFQVYTDSFYPKGLEAAKYIGRYLGHPPLATSHITHYDGQRVQFWYRETATGLRREVNVSALEFISLLVQHIPPRGMQLMRHAGLYARNVKAKWAKVANAALEALRIQMPLFDLEPLVTFFKTLTWRERIKASFGYDPLECKKCGCFMELVEIWEPQRGHVWMKRWLETHRRRKAARDALSARLAAHPARLTQLAFAFDTY